MTIAKHDDIVRLFPGIHDRTVLQIQATNATMADLEAALLSLQGEDEGLLEFKQRQADRLNQLLAILADWEALSANDVNR
jgi:hypothetical protein